MDKRRKSNERDYTEVRENRGGNSLKLHTKSKDISWYLDQSGTIYDYIQLSDAEAQEYKNYHFIGATATAKMTGNALHNVNCVCYGNKNGQYCPTYLYLIIDFDRSGETHDTRTATVTVYFLEVI